MLRRRARKVPDRRPRQQRPGPHRGRRRLHRTNPSTRLRSWSCARCWQRGSPYQASGRYQTRSTRAHRAKPRRRRGRNLGRNDGRLFLLCRLPKHGQTNALKLYPVRNPCQPRPEIRRRNMRLSGLAALLLAGLASCRPGTAHGTGHLAEDAHGTHAPESPPLRYAEHVSSSFLRVLPSGSEERLARAPLSPPPAQVDLAAAPDASLLLVLDAFNATFRFVLRPDSRVLHPRATWVSLDGEGRVQEEPLVRRVYRGSVLRERREQGEHFGIDPLDFLSHMRGSALGRGPYRAAVGGVSDRFDDVGEATFVFGDEQRRSGYRIGARSFQSLMPEFRGQFSVNGDMHHVLTSGHYRRSKREEDAEPRSRHDRGIFENGPSAPLALDSDPVIWRESDRGRSSSFGPRERKIRGLCAVADPTSSDALGKAGEVALHRRLLEEFGQDYRSSPLYRRSVSLGCPAQLGELMLYMTAVADCNYVAKYGGASQARDAIINTWARVSSIFESNMNIYIGLVSVQTFATCGTNSTPFNRACSAGYTITQRLSDFSSWRGTQTGNVSELSGLYHLVSTCATGPQVGIAWLNTLCQKNSFSQADSTYGQLYVSGTGVSAITTGIQDESKVVAHEIGHNFGSVHDCTSSTCPVVMDGGSPSCCSCTAEFGCDCREQFLMNPFDDSKSRNFSTCTKDMMCQKLGTIGRCLEAPGLHETASRFVCGNGIREGSEQCGSPSMRAQGVHRADAKYWQAIAEAQKLVPATRAAIRTAHSKQTPPAPRTTTPVALRRANSAPMVPSADPRRASATSQSTALGLPAPARATRLLRTDRPATRPKPFQDRQSARAGSARRESCNAQPAIQPYRL